MPSPGMYNQIKNYIMAKAVKKVVAKTVASKKAFAKKVAGKKITAKKAASKKTAANKAAPKKNKLGVKNSLVNNINAKKKKGTSKPKAKSTVSKKEYNDMENNWENKESK